MFGLLSRDPGVDTTSEGSKRRSSSSWAVAGVLACLLLYWSLRGIEWSLVWHAILSARWKFVAEGVALTAVTYFLRSLRWRVLLNAEARLSVATVFWSTMAGYLGNNILPARGGELVRTFMISRHSSLSETYVLTTALAERMTDAVALVFIGSLVLVRVNPKPRWMDDVFRTTALIGALGCILILVLPHFEGFLSPLLRRAPLAAAIRTRLLFFANQVLLGLRAFHDARRLLSFVSFTAIIWALDAVAVMCATHGFGMHISFSLALLLLTGLGLGSALPSTPGYVGIYQFVAITILTPFGIDRNDALAYIITGQVLGYLMVLALGALGLYWLRKSADQT
jgi:uncharacterized protein (TIRG00374 family)